MISSLNVENFDPKDLFTVVKSLVDGLAVNKPESRFEIYIYASVADREEIMDAIPCASVIRQSYSPLVKSDIKTIQLDTQIYGFSFNNFTKAGDVNVRLIEIDISEESKSYHHALYEHTFTGDMKVAKKLPSIVV